MSNNSDDSGCAIVIIFLLLCGVLIKGCEALEAYTEKTKVETERLK